MLNVPFYFMHISGTLAQWKVAKFGYHGRDWWLTGFFLSLTPIVHVEIVYRL